MADLYESVADYYSARLAEHGDTARGVDWNSAEGQALRFDQLLRVVEGTGPFSVNDLGCGYGALRDHLAARFSGVSYIGTDIAPAMIAAARARHAGHPAAEYHVGAAPPRIADYTLASGIFNVRLQHDDERWRAYIVDTLAAMDRSSRRGFAFNCLTMYSDEHRKQARLFYADPSWLFDHCMRSYSRHVALLHDYGLYEFTILVRKPA